MNILQLRKLNLIVIVIQPKKINKKVLEKIKRMKIMLREPNRMMKHLQQKKLNQIARVKVLKERKINKNMIRKLNLRLS